MANKYDHTKSVSYFDDEPLRHRSVTKRAHSNAEEIPMWPIITGLAVVFIWAVNTVSPGTINFVTGISFLDSVLLGTGGGFLGYLIYRNWQAWHFDIEEIVEVAESAAVPETESINRLER